MSVSQSLSVCLSVDAAPLHEEPHAFDHGEGFVSSLLADVKRKKKSAGSCQSRQFVTLERVAFLMAAALLPE